MVEGALILLAGLVLGRLWPRGPRRPLTDPPLSLRCTCRHQKSSHDKGSGFCHQIVDMVFPGQPDEVAVQCPCQVYIGPEQPEVIVSNWMPSIGPSRRR